MKRLEYKWINRAEDFCTLHEEWNELLANSPCDSLFLTWEWQYFWWLHLAGDRKLSILTVRSDGRLMAIAPMSVKPPDLKRMLPFRVLELLGTGSVGSDYLSIIVRDGEENSVMPTISAALFRKNRVLELSNIDRGSRVVTLAALAMNALGCRTARQTQSFSPYIDLTGFTWDSYMTRNDSAHKTRFDKKLRRLKKSFCVRFEQTSAESTRPRDLQIMIDLHMQRWDSKGGSNAFNSESLCNFHHAFTDLALQKDWLRLFIMWLDDKPAAAVYGFYYKDTFYYYQAGFDPDYGQYSVGYLAIGLTVELALQEGAKEYDMLRGNEEYKYAWATDERELVRLTIFPPTTKGRLCEQYLDLRERAKTVLMENTPLSIKEWVLPSA